MFSFSTLLVHDKRMMSTLSEAYRDYPVHLHHIIPLDFNSVRVVPESHVWPKSDDFSPSSDQVSVPIIDLNDPQATQLISDACETWGVFQLVNHGIPSSLLKDAESESLRLFSLPAKQKLKALRAPGGATGYGLPRLTQFFSKYMWIEGFTIMGSPFDHARELWPHDHARFCDAMEKYGENMRILAERIMKLIFKSLDMSEEEAIRADSSGAIQLNSYPSCPDPSQAVGLAPHTDSSFFTVIHQSATSGLQIFKEGVGWVSVLPIADALVVNVGDLLHILSNARFSNVLHRVLVNQKQQRLSLAYFHSPPLEFNITPIATAGQVRRFRSVTKKEFIGLKAKSHHKAVSFLEI